jgi:hypothetical protein
MVVALNDDRGDGASLSVWKTVVGMNSSSLPSKLESSDALQVTRGSGPPDLCVAGWDSMIGRTHARAVEPA